MSIREISKANERIVLLLTPGFEEGTAVYCLDRMREAGLPVSVVGLSDTSIRGNHGIAIEPDYTLDQLCSDSPYPLLILSGGRQYVASLLVDPRFHKLYQSTINRNGYLASTTQTAVFLEKAGISKSKQILTQGSMDAADFANYLINIAQSVPI